MNIFDVLAIVPFFVTLATMQVRCPVIGTLLDTGKLRTSLQDSCYLLTPTIYRSTIVVQIQNY